MSLDQLAFDLEERILVIAVDVAKDYPNIEKVGSFEQLYAIHCAYQGANEACQQLHRVIKHLAKCACVTDDQLKFIFDLYEK